MEELEESVWSVVRQETECEDQGKAYRTVVRPALLYGADTSALKNSQEKKSEVAEIRMLRWMCGVSKLDKIRYEGQRKWGKSQRKSKKGGWNGMGM